MKFKEFVIEAAKPKTAKPRNFVAKNASKTTSGSGAHKDKKRAEKQGDVKHKKQTVSMEGVKSQGIPKKKEDKFHSDLDKLVHKTFGHSPEEEKEKKSVSKKSVKEALKDRSLQALQQAKQELEKDKSADMDAWERDFRQNYAPKFAHLKKPEKEIPDISSIGLEKPKPAKKEPKLPKYLQGNYPEVKARADFVNSIIDKTETLEKLKEKADKLGILSSTLKSELDLNLYINDAQERGDYELLDQKVDEFIEKLQNRIRVHRAAYRPSRKNVMNSFDNKVSEVSNRHISPSGVKTNMDPSDDDYAINYGKNGLVAKFRKAKDVAEVSKSTIDRYVAKASDAHGHADFAARISKDDPTLRSYHKDQKRTAEKRRQGISRALDRMSKNEGVSEAFQDKKTLEERLSRYEGALRQARNITKIIKSADMHMEIINEIIALAKSTGIETTDFKYQINEVNEAVRNLQKEVYNLVEPFEDAVNVTLNAISELEEEEWQSRNRDQ